jgi:predicted DsbA family dithiol-disulfide isomerase
LHPETPEEGQTLQQLFAGRDIDIPAVMTRLRTVAAELNLPWRERTMTYNSRRATELGKWAEALGQGEVFHDAVFRAYFADGINIANIEVLKKLCRNLGLDPSEAEGVLEEGSYGKAVENDWLYSRQLGVTAVPTFLAAGRIVVGAQPYEILEKLVKAGIEKGPELGQHNFP